MMTQQLEVSILAAPLAAIDRRVLSQAWYSALRYARVGLDTATPIRRARLAGPAAELRCDCVHELFRRQRSDVMPRFASVSTKTATGNGAQEAKQCNRSRALHSAVPGEPATGSVPPPLRRATFSIGRGSGRVCIVLQTKGCRVLLVAFCKPEMHEVVASALARARRALAVHGIGVEIGIRGERACS